MFKSIKCVWAVALVLTLYMCFAGSLHAEWLDVEVEGIEKHAGYVVVDLVVAGETQPRQTIFTVSDVYNALTVASSVSISKLGLQLQQWGIKTQFRNEAAGATLFFEAFERGPIAFVYGRRTRRTSRYQLHLYLEAQLNLDDLYTRGEAFFEAGQEAEALRHWHFILSRYRLHRKTVYRLADYHFARGDFKQAEELYEIIIDLDERHWEYPEARVQFALAADKLPGGMQSKHGMCLGDYVRYGKGEQVLLAERLLRQVDNPVEMQAVTSMEKRALLRKVLRGNRVIVQFWSPEDEDAWRYLEQLFAFSVRYRDIPIYLVATEDGNKLRQHERRLTEKYAPFWPLSGRGNVHFWYDETHLLQQELFGSTVKGTHTLFLARGAVLQHAQREVSWGEVDPLQVWNNE